MDFFKPGSVSLYILRADGSVMEIDTSDLSPIGETELQPCDCPPGVCLGEAQGELAGDESDEDVIFFEEEGIDPADRLEAVAQLGRITESLATLANTQAQLLSDLLEG